MNAVFHLAGAIAIVATFRAVTGRNPIHALLYLVVSLLSLALVFYTLGAPFAAALEVIVYAGAIIVLFVFVVMMLNLGPPGANQEREWLRPRNWIGPALLCAPLLAELIYLLVRPANSAAGTQPVEPSAVGATLFGPYLIGVDLASLLLLAGLVGACHLARRAGPDETVRVAQASSPAGSGGAPPPVSGAEISREPAAGAAALRSPSANGGL